MSGLASGVDFIPPVRTEELRGEETKLARWNSRVKGGRDLFLVASGGVYVCGYLARAFHAWSESLGVLPALDFQYFVAGIVLLVPPAGLVGLSLGYHHLLRRYVLWEQRGQGRKERTDRVLVGSMVITIMAFAGAGPLGATSFPRAADLASRIAGVVLVASFLTLFWLFAVRSFHPTSGPPASAPITDRVGSLEKTGGFRMGLVRVLTLSVRGMAWLYGALVVSWMGLLALAMILVMFLLGLIALPGIPQELGGAKPRCGILEIDTRAISGALAARLIPIAASGEKAAHPIQLTKPMSIYHSHSDVLLIREPLVSGARRPVIELRRSVVVAISSCDRP
jgi:hypothetical protein